jgi:hypothetical protein
VFCARHELGLKKQWSIDYLLKLLQTAFCAKHALMLKKELRIETLRLRQSVFCKAKKLRNPKKINTMRKYKYITIPYFQEKNIFIFLGEGLCGCRRH